MWLWPLILEGHALAEPLRGAILADVSLSNADRRGQLAARIGNTGPQLGLEVRGADLTKAWIDGWPVTGAAVSGLVLGALPLVRTERMRLDLEVRSGVRSLPSRQLVLLSELSPRAALRLSEASSVRLGFENVANFQLDPSFATDALGQLLGGGLAVAPTKDIQLALMGEAGGVYGYDGDGGKFVTRVGASVRIVPGAARTWWWL